jgi:hypothetical protein
VCCKHRFFLHFHTKDLDVSLLKKLKITLLNLQAVLNDAEEKQITNSAVKQWLDELTHAVFDADDLLDEINTDALRFKIEGSSQIQTVTDQVMNYPYTHFKRFSKPINSRMHELFERLEHFVLQKDILQLKKVFLIVFGMELLQVLLWLMNLLFMVETMIKRNLKNFCC